MTRRELVRLAGSLRLATRALRAAAVAPSAAEVASGVLHRDHSHFVVLTRVGARNATIHDPSIGRRTIALEELSKHFTGIVLEAWPTSDFQQKVERARIRVRDPVARTHGFRAAASRVLLVSLVIELLVIALPIDFQLVLDEVVSDDRDLLLLIALGLALLVNFRSAVEFVR